jgi:hypothetical protein
MASQHLATISEAHSTPCETQRRSLLRHWLGVFALNAGQALDGDALSVYVTLWAEGFADLSDDVLEAAFRKTLATCKYWPLKVADVREHVERAEDSRAEDEWQRLLEYVRRHVNADLGMAHAPKLPADIAHAAAAAGGLYFLESCATDELQWAKKRFLEDLTRQRKAGDIAACLPDSPLGKMLEAAAVRFALPAAASAPLTDPRQPVEVLRSLRDAPPKPSFFLDRASNPKFTAWQDRQAETDPVAAEYRKAHGL